MGWIGDDARRLLAKMEARSAKGKASRSLETPGEIKRPMPRDDAASTGNQPTGGVSGRDHAAGSELGSGLRIGCRQEFTGKGAGPEGYPVVTTTCPLSKRLVAGAVSGLVQNSPALRTWMRHPQGARPGGDMSPRRTRPVACNDDVRGQPNLRSMID